MFKRYHSDQRALGGQRGCYSCYVVGAMLRGRC
uniref:Uncharacterized protein n=1 Tax=Anguilla anguilla TaxID=7936 RepID=A0A0E9PPK4_ANGAN